MELESNWSGTRNWIAKEMDGRCLSWAKAGGMQRERVAGSLAKVAGITSIHLAPHICEHLAPSSYAINHNFERTFIDVTSSISISGNAFQL